MKLINDKQWLRLRARILALIGDRPRSQRQFAALVIDGALCLAAACHVPGTIPNAMVRSTNGALAESLRIGHPSG